MFEVPKEFASREAQGYRPHINQAPSKAICGRFPPWRSGLRRPWRKRRSPATFKHLCSKGMWREYDAPGISSREECSSTNLHVVELPKPYPRQNDWQHNEKWNPPTDEEGGAMTPSGTQPLRPCLSLRRNRVRQQFQKNNKQHNSDEAD